MKSKKQGHLSDDELRAAIGALKKKALIEIKQGKILEGSGRIVGLQEGWVYFDRKNGLGTQKLFLPISKDLCHTITLPVLPICSFRLDSNFLCGRSLSICRYS